VVVVAAAVVVELAYWCGAVRVAALCSDGAMQWWWYWWFWWWWWYSSSGDGSAEAVRCGDDETQWCCDAVMAR
jgi:hypothetical protein